MNSNDRPAKRAHANGVLGNWLTAGGLAAAMVLLAGCGKEFRISLSEFLAMQEEAQKTGQGLPETRPAPPPPLTAEERAVIDRDLGPYRVGPGNLLAVDIIGPEQTGARTTPTGTGSAATSPPLQACLPAWTTTARSACPRRGESR